MGVCEILGRPLKLVSLWWYVFMGLKIDMQLKGQVMVVQLESRTGREEVVESATSSGEDGVLRGDGHDEKEGDRSPVSASTGTGTGTGRDGSESSGTRATSPDIYLTEPRDGETKGSCEGSSVSAHPIRRTTSAQCEGGIVKRGVLSHRESDPVLTLTTGGAKEA